MGKLKYWKLIDKETGKVLNVLRAKSKESLQRSLGKRISSQLLIQQAKIIRGDGTNGRLIWMI
jgi:hypothetical protein